MNFCKAHNITYRKFLALKRASHYYFSGRCNTRITSNLVWLV